jgi:hypothetical protein
MTTRPDDEVPMVNAIWHKAHPMPAGATPQQRLRGHVAHAKACGCRKLTASMLRELRRRAKSPRSSPERS